MGRLLAMAGGKKGTGARAGAEVILEFMGLRPPYRLDLTTGEALRADDPRRTVFEAQLTYILNTGGVMFVITPLPLKPVRTDSEGVHRTLDSCSVSAVRFRSGRWFPVPADQVDALFGRPPERDARSLWLFRDFPGS